MAEYIEPTDEELWDMSDEEMDLAFKAAKAAQSAEVDEIEPEPEETDDLEQPEMDSDDDVTDDEVIDVTEEEISEPEESTDEAEEEQDEPEVTEVKEPEVKVDSPRFKTRANGMDFDFSQDEVNDMFPKMFSKAQDYTKKMQAIKPYRGRIDAMEEAGITDADFSLMMDTLKGDKAALDEVLKRTGVDALDLGSDEAGVYQPKSYGRDDKQIAIDDIVGIIEQDPEYEITRRVIANQWDNSSKNMLVEDPNLINLLHVDVKSGMYDKVAPLAEKRKMSDIISGRPQKSDLDYYREVGGEYHAMQRQNMIAEEQARLKEANTRAEEAKLAQVKAETAKRNATKASAEKRKAAAPTRQATKKTVTDYLDDDEESYEEWYKSVQDKM
jgi:hypothetical protein